MKQESFPEKQEPEHFAISQEAGDTDRVPVESSIAKFGGRAISRSALEGWDPDADYFSSSIPTGLDKDDSVIYMTRNRRTHKN